MSSPDAHSVTIRRMTLADVPAVTDIERATFLTPWPDDAFVTEMGNPAARYLVAERDGEVLGYAGAWIILDESHITNVAVRSDCCEQGIGRMLATALMQYLANLGAGYATLEVRKSNLAAQALYVSLGFIRLGVKKRYYEDNGEDALFMVCTAMPDADPEFEEPETVTA